MSIAYTSGEPSGIGPDIAVIYAQKERTENLQVYCDPDVLINRAKILKLPLTLTENPTRSSGELSIFPVKTSHKVMPGKLNPDNAEYVLSLLKKATKHSLENRSKGILTGPINKSVINDAGIEFSGHTEYFAELSKSSKTVMVLATSGLKVALATTHLALKDVPKNITRESLIEVISIINNDFEFFGTKKPNILVCGLNPHAGENGYLGDEEITTIGPVIDYLNQNGFSLIGPVPADTAFTPDSLENIDVVLAMYHDQGLPVLKAKGFKNAANITLGLPFIRTSVDHGTALELAGTGKIDLGSFYCALSFFEKISKNGSHA
ncbi:4-hydroxythreonine-4-phosphate dehydrogenase PdxA [Pseudothioglobus sp. nBUS_23]|uniref:4-hydroxythreonine-4-phosphate dehydrogenase PdxA n=1 Tax=Pseudothioglobus sp. nBUS_23 TaxID=3395318 RepID=UPI003EBA01CA